MKTDVNDITIDDFRQALEVIWTGKVTKLAPLGYSSDDCYLYKNETPGVSHSGCVKLRSWSGMPELLIGNKAGKWLAHMKIDRVMGFEYILNEFHRQFENVKHLIDRSDKKELHIELSAEVKQSVGFAIMDAALKSAAR